jgi:hypothetical protein
MSQARDFADSFSAVSTGRKNLSINGAMNVAQRAELTAARTGYGKVDRFKIAGSGAQEFTFTQSTEVPSGEGFSNSLKLDCTTADTSLAAAQYQLIQHRFEGQDLQHLLYGTSDAKTITISFWVRSTKTGTYIAEWRHNDASYSNSRAYTINTADTWQRVELTYSGYTTTALDNDENLSAELNLWLQAGTTYSSGTLSEDTWTNTNANRAVGQVNFADSTSNDFYITGVQIEVGNSASPFEHRSYAEELALCRRYYQELTGWGKVFHVYSSTAAYAMFEFNPEMRATPTLTATTTDFRFYSGADTETISQMNPQNATNRQFQFYLQGTGFNAGRAGHADSRSNKFYTADAEL